MKLKHNREGESGTNFAERTSHEISTIEAESRKEIATNRFKKRMAALAEEKPDKQIELSLIHI